MREAFHYCKLARCVSGGRWLTYVVMEVSVGDSDPISTVGDIKKTIQIILSEAQVTR